MDLHNPKDIFKTLKGESSHKNRDSKGNEILTEENSKNKAKDVENRDTADVISLNTRRSNASDISIKKSNKSSTKKGFLNFGHKHEDEEDKIADEDNMNYSPSHKDSENNGENDIMTGHNEDEEAGYKNLTFHGITSSLKGSLMKNKSASQTSVNEEGGKNRKSSLNLKKKFMSSAKLGKSSKNSKEENIDSEPLTKSEVFRCALQEDLFNMMLAGSPAALLFYSYFTLDHKNNRRATLLLGALSVHVNKLGQDEHVEHDDEDEDSGLGFKLKQLQKDTFRIDLEYGMSKNKMKWSVYKSYLDIAHLHSSLKVYTLTKNLRNTKNASYIVGKRGLKIPKFPRSENKKNNRRNVKYLFVKTRNAATGASSKINEKTKQQMSKFKKTSNNKTVSDQVVEPTLSQQEAADDVCDTSDNSDDAEDLTSIGSLVPSESSLESNIFNPNEHSLNQVRDIIGESANSPKLGDEKTIEDKDQSEIPNNEAVEDLLNSKKHVSHSDKKLTLSTQDNENENLNVRLEKYLKLLNVAVGLSPLANKIFHFYELSPIGVLLSYEKGFAGKQGYLMMLSSAKANGWRVSHFRINDWKAMVQRHTKKWFLVRHSYITFVSDIHSTTPLDVFLVDSDFKVIYSELEGGTAKTLNNLQITLQNSEREMKLLCNSESTLKEWVSSIEKMAASTVWSKPNRFESFAPVRQNCYAKLLVDGRDYFWALSEALLTAKDSIFIHDWWLSPELYLRRPVEGNEPYRIDRILQKKAEEGVKIFIIVYRNVGSTVGTDSSWTKHSLLSLHSNIHVIRSPNQWLQNTYFWAHHEKLAMVDNIIAFIGGIDLCYGRYDTPEHALRDESMDIPKQNFPGKDYSNARHNDFFELEKPFDSMHDRETIPRMPWHDVHMMTVGEVARDLSRHFVQRWNYLLRQKRPSRPTPLLTPPSDLTDEELKSLPYFDAIKDKSTCECQLLRSSGNWSLGLKETEDSIHKAYLKLIETSQHYMYIENQFFITSSSWDSVTVLNSIGDAIVDRIIKAHQDKTPWKAYIVIPLMPAFPSQVDKSDGSSLRLIMLSQYMSISTGENSIYGKLKKVGIDAGDYIQFYSLRKWSEIGKASTLVTEQLYVHAKILIVDDRTCIIGSANVNERSMLGNRDSEVAVIIRDTEFIKSKMNGKEYLAGKFAFEMRQRLMREHLGCDVDLVEFNERKFANFKLLAQKHYKTLHTLRSDSKKLSKKDMALSAYEELAARDVLGVDYSDAWKKIHGIIEGFGIPEKTDHGVDSDAFEDPASENMLLKKSALPSVSNIFVHTFNNRVGVFNMGIKDDKPVSTDPRVKKENRDMLNPDTFSPENGYSGTSKFVKDTSEQLNKWLHLNTHNYRKFKDDKKDDVDKDELDDYAMGFLPSREDIMEYLHAEDANISAMEKVDMLKKISYLQFLSAKKKLDCSKKDAVSKAVQPANFYESEKEYIDKIFMDDHRALDAELEQILAMVGIPEQLSVKHKIFNIDKDNLSKEEYHRVLKEKIFANSSFIDPYMFEDPLCDDFFQDLWFTIAVRNTLIFRLIFHCQPDSSVQTWSEYREFKDLEKAFADSQKEIEDILEEDNSNTSRSEGSVSDKEESADHKVKNLRLRLARGMIQGFDKKVYDKYTAVQMLNRIHGHLVLFPLTWLGREIEENNWFYNADRIPPIDIYD
ncbi:unnamed protein product [Hanseniaspora opuntiae]